MKSEVWLAVVWKYTIVAWSSISDLVSISSLIFVDIINPVGFNLFDNMELLNPVISISTKDGILFGQDKFEVTRQYFEMYQTILSVSCWVVWIL